MFLNLLEIFKKQGGFSLIRNYWRTGALFSAIITFFMLGKSRKALEILRLVTQFKTNKKLYELYAGKIDERLCEYKSNENSIEDIGTIRHVYFCWFQGLENAPTLVKKCYKSIQKHITDREIVLITEKNYKDYVKFPDFIEDKIERGIISRTHMSDLLRLELLTRYGGTWIDATVLCTAKPPAYMLDSDFFVFQLLKPGLDGHSLGLSSWFITAKPGAMILKITLDILYDYWKEYNDMCDYFLLHHIMDLVRSKCSDEWNKMVPFSNEMPHVLLLRLFEPYDEHIWNYIREYTPVHKLSYKFDDKDLEKDNTYYSQLIGDS